MSQDRVKPDGFHTITPYLVVSDASQLIDFLKSVFSAEELLRVPRPEGGIRHAEIRIGDSMLEMGDATEHWSAMPCGLHIYVPDIDATYQRALQAGAETLLEPADQEYGERSASVRDPLGNIWHIATRNDSR